MNNWHDLNETLRSWFGVNLPQAGHVAGADEDLARAQARLSLALPAAYARWWREHGGLLAEVWNVQDQLHAPDALCLAADAPGKLLIAHENQSVVRWAFDLADWAADVGDVDEGQAAAPADPPVWVEDAEATGSWRLEAESFSDWLLQRLALGVKFADAPLWRGNGSWPQSADVAQIDQLCGQLAPALHWGAVRELAWPPQACLWANDTLVLECHGDTWLWLTASSEAAWQAALARLNASALAPDWVALDGPDGPL